jgi:hypothetical protein
MSYLTRVKYSLLRVQKTCGKTTRFHETGTESIRARGKKDKTMPNGADELENGGRGHTGAKRRASSHAEAPHETYEMFHAAYESVYPAQRKESTETYFQKKKWQSHATPGGQPFARTAHQNCTRMLGLLRASRSTRDFLIYRLSGRGLPKTHTLPLP